MNNTSASATDINNYYLTAKGFLANMLTMIVSGKFSFQAKLLTALVLLVCYFFGFISVVICFFTYRFYMLIRSAKLINSQNVSEYPKLIHEWLTFCIMTLIFQIINFVLFEFLAELLIIYGYYLLVTKYEIIMNIISNMTMRIYMAHEQNCNSLMNNFAFLLSYSIGSITTLYNTMSTLITKALNKKRNKIL